MVTRPGIFPVNSQDPNELNRRRPRGYGAAVDVLSQAGPQKVSELSWDAIRVKIGYLSIFTSMYI